MNTRFSLKEDGVLKLSIGRYFSVEFHPNNTKVISDKVNGTTYTFPEEHYDDFVNIFNKISRRYDYVKKEVKRRRTPKKGEDKEK